METDTTSMETTLETEAVFQPTKADRCDRCGAQAHVQVFFNSGFDLLFCNHHRAEYSKELEQVALTIRQDSEELK